ncbi:futalosine hydrolase [Candidatus Magnetominusculus dajiuhuensis]|uniref:futalosine hydrolase n=1 Tax=Candidatus Magnetominusculus dajiuhuensis TaxID=3137712 RepID=UPI003B432903
MVIALFHAVEFEADTVIKRLRHPVRVSERFGASAVCGGLGHATAVCVSTGVGKVNAAIASSLALQKYRPDMVISMGIGGAYPNSGLVAGDIAIAQCEIYGDEGVMLEDNFLTPEAMGIPFYKKGTNTYYNTFPLDAELTRQLYDTVSQMNRTAQAGAFITVSTCTGTRKRADELTRRYNGICENMEGAAIAHASTMFGTPAVEIRGISNIAAERDKDRWETTKASQIAQDAVIMFIKSLE